MHTGSLPIPSSETLCRRAVMCSSVVCAALLIASCSTQSPPIARKPAAGLCIVNSESQPQTRTCRIHSVSEWEDLGLIADDAVSRSVLAALGERIREEEDIRNFYPSFVSGAEPDSPVLIRDREGWVLDAILESSADKTVCSHARDMNSWREESGGTGSDPGAEGPEDKKHGHRCGNISIIHSLVRLGVLSADEAYRGDHLNPDVVTMLDRYHADKPGMTPDQQRRGYGHFSTPRREINCLTTLPASTSRRGAVVVLARALRTTMQSTKPRYDCSLAVHGDRQEDGSAGLKHVEHVTGVRISPEGEYLIDTLDGFHQGTGASDIPKTPAVNTWGIGSRNGIDWVQLKGSTLESNVRRYSEIPPYWIEMRCCSLVEH